MMLSPTKIRERLRDWVSTNISICADDVLIDELGFVNRKSGLGVDATFRADLALANGRLVGFEIKSGADNLKRWPSQCEAYFRVFDEIWLCTHGKHLEKALEITPKQTGILLVDDLGGVAIVRTAKRNDFQNPYDLTGLLWREELDELCLQNAVLVRSRDTKAEVRGKVSKELEVGVIRSYVLKRLKVRRAS